MFAYSQDSPLAVKTMDSPTPDIACPGCDLLLQKIATPRGKKLFCPRCKTLLQQRKTNSISKVLAITSSGLLVYIPAVFLPLMTLNSLGMKQSGSVFDAFLSFYHQGYYFVTVLIFLTSIFFPLLKLSLLFSVSLQLKIGLYSRSLPFFLRSAHHMDDWGMADVYLIALLVSIIKIGSVADIHYDMGFYCFIFMVLMTRATTAALDVESFWRRIEAIKPPPSPGLNHG
ncbi:MAG: paraquat-inducible protein A [Thermodesulfobacteriota bacterium]